MSEDFKNGMRTVEELAEVLGVEIWVIQNIIDNHSLEPIKISKEEEFLYAKDDVAIIGKLIERRKKHSKVPRPEEDIEAIRERERYYKDLTELLLISLIENDKRQGSGRRLSDNNFFYY
jgi:hypothetical protein